MILTAHPTLRNTSSHPPSSPKYPHKHTHTQTHLNAIKMQFIREKLEIQGPDIKETVREERRKRSKRRGKKASRGRYL